VTYFLSIRVVPALTAAAVFVFSCLSLRAQSSGSFSPLSNSIATPRPFDPGSNTTNPSALAAQAQNPYLGSVPIQPLVPGILPLSLHDAVALALRANLGLVDSEQDHAQSRALRMRALSALLPHLSADATQAVQNFPLTLFGAQKTGAAEDGPYVQLPEREYQLQPGSLQLVCHS
jgi:outer membrane protein TolC